MAGTFPDFGDPLFTLVIMPLITGIIASFFVVIFYDFIIFRRFYLNLCKEIDDNYEKIQANALNSQFSRMRDILERKIQDPNRIEWIGLGKIISIWILVQKTDTTPTDYYRYLTSNDLKNFIQRGYYHYIKKCEENLTLFYLSCENLSTRTQDHERIFNYSPERLYPNFNTTATDTEKRENLEDYIRNIQAMINVFSPSIELQYTNLQPFLKKDILYVVKLYLSENFTINPGSPYMRPIYWGLILFDGLLCTILIGSSIFWGITLDGIHTLLTTYITITTAILAVTFAAIAIKPELGNTRPIPVQMKAIIILSLLGLFASIYSLYYSFYCNNALMGLATVLFYCSTILTFSSIIATVTIFDAIRTPS